MQKQFLVFVMALCLCFSGLACANSEADNTTVKVGQEPDQKTEIDNGQLDVIDSNDDGAAQAAAPAPVSPIMKEYAERIYDFFDHEAEVRAVARQYAIEIQNHKVEGKYPSDYLMAFIKEIDSQTDIGIEKTLSSVNMDAREKLDYNDQAALDKAGEGMVYYLMGLPAEEGYKAGLVDKDPFENETETPDVLKNYIKASLAPYKYDRVVDDSEAKKEIKLVWDRMRNALKSSDVDGAADCFSSSTRESYRKNFQAMMEAGALTGMANDMGDMIVTEVHTGYAEGDVRSKQDSREFSFMVRFIMEGNGDWRIQSF